MKPKITFTAMMVLLCFVLGLSAVVGYSATAKQNPKTTHENISGDMKLSGTCADINPEAGTIIEHTKIGDTWYDEQQMGSMGHMISVTPNGFREDSWTYCNGMYPAVGRYIRANQERPNNSWVGATDVDGGVPINAGYSNQSYLDGPGADNGASVLIYHRSGGTPIWYTTLAVDDEAGGQFFTRKFDVPDYITGSAYQSEWPKAEVKYDASAGKDYIHIVGTEGNTAGGVPVMVTYVRCYIKDGPALLDTLICQTYDGSAKTYKVVAGANGGGAFSTISNFDSSCSITIVPVVSKISRRVALAWLRPVNCIYSLNHCDYMSDVVFTESMNSGEDWVTGTNWPPPEYNITNYECGGTERAYVDVAACYDYEDSLHIVWNAHYFDPAHPGQIDPIAKLYHWSKKDGIVLIASGYPEDFQPPGKQMCPPWCSWWHRDTKPGKWNGTVCKPSIAAVNPIYHPDSTYLYCIWTQFNPGDTSESGYGNGDIYGAGSGTGGYCWNKSYNLTNTKIANCSAGNCLSEHWASLAISDTTLHIQYICDRDAGAAVQYEGTRYNEWTNNPVMYLHLTQWPINNVPRINYTIVSPASWYGPPLKVAPNGSVILTFTVTNIGCAVLTYHVNSDDPCIVVNTPPTNLNPHQTNTVTALVSGAGACNGTFIDGKIHLFSNDVDPANQDIPLQVQAVVSADYYECPRDPATTDTLFNGLAYFYVNANSQEWMHDTSNVLGNDTTYEVFWNGGPFVATTVAGDTLAGRYYGNNDARILAQRTLYRNDSYTDFWVEASWSASISKLYPPMDAQWWWFDILHQAVFFKSTASTDLKNCVIKFYDMYRHAPPPWWPSQPSFTGYEDTYVGLMMDIDCPYDTNAGQIARNAAGYDATNNIAWQKGSSNHGEHPAYDNYYAGIALVKGQLSESETPWGTYNLENDIHLYPQSGWGWLEGDFYQLAQSNTLGAIEEPGSLRDRSQIVTAKKIAAGNDPNIEVTFTVVEALGQTGLAQLQSRVAAARTWVAGRPFHNLCGDVSGDAQITVSDVVLLLNYLFKHTGSATLAPPLIGRADVSGDGLITVSDVVCLLNYLFKQGLPKDCFKGKTVW